jgi:hypothetical protein
MHKAFLNSELLRFCHVSISSSFTKV